MFTQKKSTVLQQENFDKKNIESVEIQENFNTILFNKFERQYALLKQQIEESYKHKRIIGIIFKNQKKEKNSDFPTINIHHSLSVPNGTYASYTTIYEKKYKSLTLICNSISRTYIFDFKDNIFGCSADIELIESILKTNKQNIDKQDVIDATRYFKMTK